MDPNADRIHLANRDLHPHLRERMSQRGVTREEIERTLNEGQEAKDAKAGTLGEVLVFQSEGEWEGKFARQKEVTVYYKVRPEGIVLLTVKARYGEDFPQE